MDEYVTSEAIAYLERIKGRTLVEIAHDINRSHQAASITARKLAIDCARIGALLLVAKEKCRSENFPWWKKDGNGWLQVHCPDISKWTADRYIKVFNRFKDEGALMHLEDDTVGEEDILQMSVTQAYITLGIVKITSQVGVKSSRNQKIFELEQEVQQLRAENKLLKAMISEMSGWLTDEQQTQLEQIAQEKQVEFKDILREAIDLYLWRIASDKNN